MGLVGLLKQNTCFLNIIHKLRYSKAVRILMKPAMDVKSYIVLKKFQKTDDAKKIRDYKNYHAGERCFIVGNGPSLTVEDLGKIENEVSFACNRIYSIFDNTKWRPTYYMCMDAMVYSTGVKENLYQMPETIKFIRNTCKKHGIPDVPGIIFFIMYYKVIINLEKYKKKKISTDVSKFFTMNFSIAQNMIELAIYMGFKDIYLIGIDHNFPVIKDKNGKIIHNNIKGHFDGAGSKSNNLDMCFYDSSTMAYQAYEDYAQRHGINIFNATRGGKLEVFRRVDLDKILEDK